MKKLLVITLFFVSLISLFNPSIIKAANPLNDLSEATPNNLFKYFAAPLKSSDCPEEFPADETPYGLFGVIIGTVNITATGAVDPCGNILRMGLLPQSGQFVAALFNNQVSGQEYINHIADNIGIPRLASSARAQGTGYAALSPFLEFWKVFRNLAYSLYIVMFVVVGIMIMLRTKVNAQTVITIQAALPNLLITLILITFSYAIVGFMVDIMYFLIYFMVYLMNLAGIISDPAKLITRFLSYSAWSVIFEGRNSIISAVASSMGSVLWGLGTGALGVAGAALSIVSPAYLIVAVAFIIAMLKLMFVLVKSYVMLIVQVVTAPVQILLNAMPGSKAFSEWFKKTASYLIPFPVAAGMFIFSAILVGNPSDKTVWGQVASGISEGAVSTVLQDDNPFGINQGAAIYQNGQAIWLPPFTLTDADVENNDILVLIGFFVFMMTPSAVKMAQDWLQVKESPYTAEALSTLNVAGVQVGGWPIRSVVGSFERQAQYRQQAKIFGNKQYNQPGTIPTSTGVGEKEPSGKG